MNPFLLYTQSVQNAILISNSFMVLGLFGLIQIGTDVLNAMGYSYDNDDNYN